MKLTDEAVEAAARVIAEGNSRAWLTYSGETRTAIARSWEPTARAAITTAFHHLTDDGAADTPPADTGVRSTQAAESATPVGAGTVAPSSPHMEPVSEQIATIIEEYADDLEPPTTVEWLELRDWFKDLLHEVAAKAREIGGAS
jgi:hypothetical protein